MQIAQAVVGIFVEAAGHNQPIPGDNAGVPHFPAVIAEAIFDGVRAVGLLPVPAVLVNGRHQIVAVLVIINLGGFQANFIHA